jgi:glutamine synthetase
LLREASLGELVSETEALVDDFIIAIKALEAANLAENQPHGDVLTHAKYMRDEVVPAMEAVRGVADRLEKVVADDLWPLPKYSEILFIK